MTSLNARSKRRLIGNGLLVGALGAIAQASYAQAAGSSGAPAGTAAGSSVGTRVGQSAGIAVDQSSATTAGVPAGATSDPAASATAGQDNDGIQDIIVTAQRRAQNLQETPLAVTAFTARDLQEKDVRNIRDLIDTVPNLHSYRSPGTRSNQVLFAIRGLNVNGTPLGAQPTVGIYVDDVFYPALTGSLLRVADLQSVEVLRGPQGTLFGRNSLGGAVRYNTVKPDQTFGGDVEFTGGERNRREFSGALNIPLGDILAVRISGGSFEQDGYVKDITTGKPVGNTDDKVARVQARLTPASNLTIDLTGEYTKSKIDGDNYVVDAIQDAPFTVQTAVGPLVVNQLLQSLFPGQDSRYDKACRYCSSGSDVSEYGNTTIKDVRGTVAWKATDNLTLKSLTSYFDIDSAGVGDDDHSTALTSVSTTKSNLKSVSQEFQANGTAIDNRLNYTAGLYFYHSNQRFTSILDFPAYNSFGLPNSSGVKNTAYAVYGQASFEFVPGLIGTVGGRYGRESVDVFVGPTIMPPGPAVYPPKQTYGSFTPQAKLQYQVTPDIMTYLSAAKGFRSGTINTINSAIQLQVTPAQAVSAVRPDTVWSYEAGVRSRFFDHHLQINATVFDAEYKNIQLTFLVPPMCPPPGSPVFCAPIPAGLTQNAGDARFRGVELESQASLGNLRLNATLATLSAHYTRIASLPNASPLTALTTHSYFEHAPKLTYSVGGDYTIPLPLGSVVANAEYRWQAKQVAGPTDYQSGFLKAYGLLDVGLSWQLNDKLTLSVTGKNVLNKFYTQDAIFALAAAGQQYSIPGEPSTWSAGIRYRF